MEHEKECEINNCGLGCNSEVPNTHSCTCKGEENPKTEAFDRHVDTILKIACAEKEGLAAPVSEEKCYICKTGNSPWCSAHRPKSPLPEKECADCKEGNPHGHCTKCKEEIGECECPQRQGGNWVPEKDDWRAEMRKRWYLHDCDPDLGAFTTCEKEVEDFISQVEQRAREAGIEEGRNGIRQDFCSKEAGIQEENARIVGIVKKWIETSNPAYAQDLFDALKQ